MTTNVNSSEVSFKVLNQDLIEGCKSGDQRAQFQIYKLYYKAMYNSSLRIVNNRMEAEDIMQESFLSSFEKIDTYSGTVSFGAWLKKIVINRSLDSLRKGRKEIFEDIESLPDLEVEENYDFFPEEEQQTILGETMEAIERLPEKYRIMISLNLLEGYDHDEIGEILSISSGTSRSLLSRAIRKLRVEIGEKRTYRVFLGS